MANQNLSLRETSMTKKRAGSLIFLIAGIYGLILSLRIPMGRWNEPGAGVFPLIISILLCISGIPMFFYGRGKAKMDWRAIVKQQWIPFQVVVLTAGFILALDPLGYIVTSSLYMFFLLFWVSRYRLWFAMGLAIIVGAGSWYIFEKLLAVPLPSGIL